LEQEKREQQQQQPVSMLLGPPQQQPGMMHAMMHHAQAPVAGSDSPTVMSAAGHPGAMMRQQYPSAGNPMMGAGTRLAAPAWPPRHPQEVTLQQRSPHQMMAAHQVPYLYCHNFYSFFSSFLSLFPLFGNISKTNISVKE
jgi:hypothetical protein